MDPNKILPQGLEIPDRKHQIQWLKLTLLAALAVIGFGITWMLTAAGFARGLDLGFWIYPAFTAAIGIAFLSFLGIVSSNKWVFWLTNGSILAWYIVVMPKDIFVMLAGVVFLLLSIWFEQRIRQDEKGRVDFSLNRIIRYNLPLMVYALLVIIGVNIYLKTKEEFNQNPHLFYNQVGHYAARGLEHVPNGLGDFDPDQSFDEFVVKQAEKQDPQFQSEPEVIKTAALNQIRQQLAERFHLRIEGNPLLGEVVAGAVSEKVEEASVSYQRFFPAIFAIIILALLRSLAFIFVWLTLLITWLVYRLLLMFNFFRIEKVEVEVNKLQI